MTPLLVVVLVLIGLGLLSKLVRWLRVFLWVASRTTPKEKMEADILWAAWRRRNRR